MCLSCSCGRRLASLSLLWPMVASCCHAALLRPGSVAFFYGAPAGLTVAAHGPPLPVDLALLLGLSCISLLSAGIPAFNLVPRVSPGCHA